ncbi:hydrolase TatD [Pseudomonas sp. 21]|uniref:TatD family hydrolase n=1 Tax=unclassified Pseudomonas TaxID=196821 RepID=UPI0005EAE9C7|nr:MULTISPECIES: TatD family hydrolase [unclassified Pseudomonas]KJK01562.1 hydrolase TatD [Pseudomonas sp. 21]MBV7582205.1 TatD family hydrolase [Pseudomonas sp. PDM33]
MRLIDTHNHLDCPDFEQDRAAVLQRSRERGVERQVLLGVFRENWEDVWALVDNEPDLYAALGLHPIYLARHRPEHLTALREWLQRLAGHPKLCAVGEIGLDYYLEELDRDGQQAIFEEQLRIAIDFELPVLLHVRRAHAAMIATLKRYKPARQGIIHAFAGSREEAREYLKLGFRLGLGGAPTWPQANRLRKVVPEIPLESIVLETDSPDMAPSMYPGVRNSPEHLPEICTALAELKGISPEDLASASTRNAMELFGWR